MQTIDLQFFMEPPILDMRCMLAIEALAPLSMVAAQPGKYYRSQPTPTSNMLYGLMENALGWHLFESLRKQTMDELKKTLKKQYKNDPEWIDSDWIASRAEASAVGYMSLLQYHIQFKGPAIQPDVISFDDLWSQQLHDTGRSFFGGSNHYDSSLSSLLNREKGGLIEFGDRAEFQNYSQEELMNAPDGAKIKYNAIRAKYPQYYVSPTVREYVIPQRPYLIGLDTTSSVSSLLKKAFDDPAAPLYLGSNDGWVEVNYQEL
jgi:CRISPR-associated protein Cas5